MQVVHRDIKLENILLDSKRSMKLIDFGLAAFYAPGKKLRVHCGSPSYAAPEIVARKMYEGPPVDVWSLGVVLFAMLAGFLPFHSPTGNKQVGFSMAHCKELLMPALNGTACKGNTKRGLMLCRQMSFGNNRFQRGAIPLAPLLAQTLRMCTPSVAAAVALLLCVVCAGAVPEDHGRHLQHTRLVVNWGAGPAGPHVDG